MHAATRRARAADLVALCDVEPKRLTAMAEELWVPETYADFYEMLDNAKLDAVSIAVPNHLHEPLTTRALNAGCHVLCEKPMAASVAAAQRMHAAAQECGRKLMITLFPLQQYEPRTQAAG